MRVCATGERMKWSHRASSRHRAWHDVNMTKYEKPMMAFAAAFATAMAAIGWYTLIKSGWNWMVLILVLVATALVAGSWWAFSSRLLNAVAGCMLGVAFLTPTEFGYIPMIVGFVVFALLVSLRLFNELDQGGTR